LRVFFFIYFTLSDVVVEFAFFISFDLCEHGVYLLEFLFDNAFQRMDILTVCFFSVFDFLSYLAEVSFAIIYLFFFNFGAYLLHLCCEVFPEPIFDGNLLESRDDGGRFSNGLFFAIVPLQ
jgi:hypothetical protein